MISALSDTFAALRPGAVQAPALASPAALAPNAVSEASMGFGQAMAEVASDAARALKGAETSSIQGIHGQATTQAVVDAVMNAERTLQTAVAVRDKAVAAYLELSRMSI